MARNQGVCCESETNRHCHCDLPIDCDCPDCVGCTCSDASTSASEARTATISDQMPTDSPKMPKGWLRGEETEPGEVDKRVVSSPVSSHMARRDRALGIIHGKITPVCDETSVVLGPFSTDHVPYRKLPKSSLRLARRAKWGNR